MTTSAVNPNSPDIFEQLRSQTIGLHTRYPVRDARIVQEVLGDNVLSDGTLPQTYLDSGASALLLQPIADVRDRALDHYANAHSHHYPSAQIIGDAFARAHRDVLRFVGADPKTHTAVFVGDGATGGVNRAALNLFGEPRSLRESRFMVLYGETEHHANQLPWKRYAEMAEHFSVDDFGAVDLRTDDEYTHTLPNKLKDNAGSVRVVAFSGASNVTGILPDVETIAALSRQAGAESLMDAAQRAAHMPIDMRAMGVDALVLSGHKMYAPGSPGVLVMPRVWSPEIPVYQGGGIVASVGLDHVHYSQKLPDREEAGTPHLVGAIMEAAALNLLREIGMARVRTHEFELTKVMVDGLKTIPEATLYGDTDLRRTPRTGVVVFNIGDLPHTIVSKALADYFAIATRNGCFCAHPYVKRLMNVDDETFRLYEERLLGGDRRVTPGMVRASLGIYSSGRDIERLLKAVRWIAENRERILKEYFVDEHGDAHRHDGWSVDIAARVIHIYGSAEIQDEYTPAPKVPESPPAPKQGEKGIAAKAVVALAAAVIGGAASSKAQALPLPHAARVMASIDLAVPSSRNSSSLSVNPRGGMSTITLPSGLKIRPWARASMMTPWPTRFSRG